MSFEIGPLPPIGNGSAPRRAPAPTPGFSLDLARPAAKPAAIQDGAQLSEDALLFSAVG